LIVQNYDLYHWLQALVSSQPRVRRKLILRKTPKLRACYKQHKSVNCGDDCGVLVIKKRAQVVRAPKNEGTIGLP
jgi:hypothetical protein